MGVCRESCAVRCGRLGALRHEDVPMALGVHEQEGSDMVFGCEVAPLEQLLHDRLGSGEG